MPVLQLMEKMETFGGSLASMSAICPASYSVDQCGCGRELLQHQGLQQRKETANVSA